MKKMTFIFIMIAVVCIFCFLTSAAQASTKGEQLADEILNSNSAPTHTVPNPAIGNNGNNNYYRTYAANPEDLERRMKKMEEGNRKFQTWTKRQFRYTEKKHNALKSYVVSENKSFKERFHILENKEAYLFWIVMVLAFGAIVIGVGHLGLSRRERRRQ